MSIALIRAGFVGIAMIASPVPFAAAQSFSDLIAEYEAFNLAGNPDEAARARGEDAVTWSDVTPETMAQRASAAANMLAALDEVELQQQIHLSLLGSVC